MEKLNIFFVDKNAMYLKGICNFIKNNYSELVDVFCFENIQGLRDKISTNINKDILVIDNDLVNEEFDMSIFKTVCLLAANSEEVSSEYAVISKYQPGPKLYESIVQANKERNFKIDKEEIQEGVKEPVKQQIVSESRENTISVINKITGNKELLQLLVSKEDVLLVSFKEEINSFMIKLLTTSTLKSNNRIIVDKFNEEKLLELYPTSKRSGQGLFYTAIGNSSEDFIDTLEFNLVREHNIPYELVKKIIIKSIKKVIFIGENELVIKDILEVYK